MFYTWLGEESKKNLRRIKKKQRRIKEEPKKNKRRIKEERRNIARGTTDPGIASIT